MPRYTTARLADLYEITAKEMKALLLENGYLEQKEKRNIPYKQRKTGRRVETRRRKRLFSLECKYRNRLIIMITTA
jgi:hypothetical protein